MAVGLRHPPLWLQIYWNILITCIGGRGVYEKVGPVVKWASRYYWYHIHVNQYVCGFSSFLALFVFFVLYFKIFNSLLSICQLYACFSAFLFTWRRPWKTRVFSVSPLPCRRNARIELLVLSRDWGVFIQIEVLLLKTVSLIAEWQLLSKSSRFFLKQTIIVNASQYPSHTFRHEK